MSCTRCESTGFLNIDQLPDGLLDKGAEAVLDWINDSANMPHDVAICDCCGNGSEWYGEPGEHDSKDYGSGGPYGYNGGVPECD